MAMYFHSMIADYYLGKILVEFEFKLELIPKKEISTLRETIINKDIQELVNLCDIHTKLHLKNAEFSYNHLRCFMFGNQS